MPFSRLLVASVCLLATLAACERARPVYVPVVEQAVDTRPIWIGEFGSWTGTEARAGLSHHRGFQLAIEAANARGGVRGRPLRVHAYDDQSRSGGARAAAQRLVQTDNVVLIVGGTSPNRATSAARAAEGVPVVSPAFIVPATGAVEWLAVSVDPGPPAHLQPLAAHLRERGFERVTVLRRPMPTREALWAAAFVSLARDHGIEQVDQLELSAETLDATVAALGEDPPPAIFVPSSGHVAAEVCSVLRRRGVTAPLFTAGPPDLAALPPEQRAALDGVVAATACDPGATEGAAADLAEVHRARFGGRPDQDEHFGYLAGLRAVATLERAREYWPDDVRAALRATEDPPVRFVIVRVEQGELRRVDTPRD